MGKHAPLVLHIAGPWTGRPPCSPPRSPVLAASGTGTHYRTATSPPRYAQSAAPSMTADAGSHPSGVAPSDRNQVIVTQAAGRDLTRRQMIDILLAAGYREVPQPVG